MEQTENFHLGLCLAGAISAGAYTAGVLDYLFEALKDWEEKKKTGSPSEVPQHTVKLSVIGGASAGGMTGMIAGLSLFNGFAPAKKIPQNLNSIIPENPFYHAWVDQLEEEITSCYRSMFDYLLNTEDVQEGNVHSLLNSNFVSKIADKIIDSMRIKEGLPSFVSDQLRVFSTLTNLQGLEYGLDFIDENERAMYRIHDHRDFACFHFGEKPIPGWEKVDTNDLAVISRYKLSAIGTGAFPIGLAPVKLERRSELMNGLSWLAHLSPGGGSRFETDRYSSLFVDGGMMNNEPFEKVREALNECLGLKKEYEDQNYSSFNSTVLMVDPFPSDSNFIKPGNSLLGYVGNVLAAFINQARIKPENLIKSLESDKAGQYVISPVRYTESEKIAGDKAIACGSLDGFGGFLSKEFRIHDFYLGRANCEKFLRDHFTVPVAKNNPIFEKGYHSISEENRKMFMSQTDKVPSFQIIPIFSERKEKATMPVFSNGKTWPQLKEAQIDAYGPAIRKRVQSILLNSIELGKMDYLKLWAGAKIFINGKVKNAAIDAMKESLKKHGQIH